MVSQLHEDVLEKLARATGGDYLRATSAAVDPAPIVRKIDRLEKRTIESQSLSTLEERFQWPLALAALALLVYLAVGTVRAGGEGCRRRKARLRRETVPARPAPVTARAHVVPALLAPRPLALPSLPRFPRSWQPHLPVWVERWMYNPRERTERSIAAYAKRASPREAVGPADTAARLAPDDPTVQYDAGTAHLGPATRGRRSRCSRRRPRRRRPSCRPPRTTTSATRGWRPATPPARWRPSSRRCASGRRTRTPSTTWSSPCARSRSRRWGRAGRPPGSRGNRTQNQDPASQQGKGNSPQQNPAAAGEQQPPNPPAAGAAAAAGAGEPQKPGEGQDDRLPQFRNQPDMNGQEAASVLSAVENLERQQRRDQAAQRARQQSAKGKDW